MQRPELKEITLMPISHALGSDDQEGVVYGYMCMTDFDCELGMACGGNIVYPSLKDIKENRKCLDQCGIVKVAVVAVEIVQEQNWDID
jgi:hypothetical protein